MRFRNLALAWGLWALAALAGWAVPRPLLHDLEMDQGSWELVGVSIHTYNMQPEQSRFGTFILRDAEALRRMRETWAFEPIYDDHCDHHYVLKFYHNRKLVKTLRVNLTCGYVTEGLFSYRLDPRRDFYPLLARSEKLPFAVVRYKDLNVLRRAARLLEADPQVRTYQDLKPFQYDGFFHVSSGPHPWNVSRDSLRQAVETRIAQAVGSRDLWVQPYILLMNAKGELIFRFEVFCNAAVGQRYTGRDRTVHWRKHLLAADDEVVVTWLGIQKPDYALKLYGRADALE
jgi:hypothetical protein